MKPYSVILIFLSFVLITPITTDTYFIDPINGSDTNTGSTSDTAFKTIAKAFIMFKANNDTVSSTSKILLMGT